MSRKARISALTGLTLAFSLAAILPLTLLALPNPPEFQKVQEPHESGAYLVDGDTILRLYPHPEPATEFPPAVAEAGPEALILVLSRQYDDLSRYVLRTASGTKTPQIKGSITRDHLLRLEPSDPLSPGEYVLEAAEDSMYGEPRFYYFRVTDDIRLQTDDGKNAKIRISE